MRALALILGFILLSGCAVSPNIARQDLHGRPGELNFQVGEERLDQPLIIALHGSSGNSIQFQVQSDLVGRVHRAGYRLALVNGQPWDNPLTYYGQQRSWNSGNCCWDRPEDDVAYLTQVIERLQTGVLGNGRKVILVGHSNGAMMSYLLMCRRPDLIHGVVGVAGTVSFDGCTPSRTRIIHIHGDRDQTVPLEGDMDLSDGRNFESLAIQQALFNRTGIRGETLIVMGVDHPLQAINDGLIHQYNFSITDKVLELAGR